MEIKLTKEKYALDYFFQSDGHPKTTEATEAYMMRQLKAEIYANVLETYTYEWPADWWQAFKLRWFPVWALRRWPARIETRKVEYKALYPDLVLPNEKAYLHTFEKRGNYFVPRID